MTRGSSIVRAGHSSWLIGGIAVLGMIALFLSAGSLRKELNDNRDRIAKQQTIQGLLQTQQEQILAQQKQERRDIRCIEQWADKSNKRDATVGKYATIRSAALSRLQLFQAKHPDANGAHLQNLRLGYVTAARVYLKAEKQYPTPQFDCANLPPVKVPRITVPSGPPVRPTESPHPRSSPSIVISRVPVPGPTTTRTVTVTAPPGKGRTVTVTATVTATEVCILKVCVP